MNKEKQLGTRHSVVFYDKLDELRVHYAKQGLFLTKSEIIERALDLLYISEIDEGR